MTVMYMYSPCGSSNGPAIRRDQVTGRMVAAMTTTPRRIALIEPVIDSLLNQSRTGQYGRSLGNPWEDGILGKIICQNHHLNRKDGDLLFDVPMKNGINH